MTGFPERMPRWQRRLKAAGAVVIGKTNLHEFAMGGTNATSYYGPVRNPWALDRNPGGSSGGSAAAVAADFVLARSAPIPAARFGYPRAYCGVVGLKATYGLVSDPRHHPAVVLARSLRPDCEDGRRRRDHAECARRIRQARYRQRRAPGKTMPRR